MTWERVDGNTSNGRPLLWDDTVSLRNISAGDAGMYNCTASNGVGDVEISVEVVVQCKYDKLKYDVTKQEQQVQH